MFAQQIIPLEANERLFPSPKEFPATAFLKMDCDNLVPEDVQQVTAGEEISFTISIDTSGFGPGGGYVCLNCDDLAFGTLTPTEGGFTYLANTDVQQGLDTLELAFCNAAGDECSVSEEAIVLVQRAPLSVEFPTEILQPQQTITLVRPPDELPGGGRTCLSFEDCEDDYLGSEQAAYFVLGTNNFAYRAARYGGVDRVCMVLCNSLGLCDEYFYSFEIVRPSINLPFFDDFSNDDNRPRLELWQNEDVLINRSYAIAPPSIGVATFDGIGPRGEPYQPQGDGFEARDYLTSASINMNGVGDQSLTFYVQPRGLGNRPERGDSLVLEFLQPNGIWRHAWSQRGLSSGEGNCTDRPFIGYEVEIPSGFNYDGFQFRFYNLSDQTGGLDHWHLDYVKIDTREAGFNTLDVALIEEPPFITTPYSAMPYRQLVAAGEDLVRREFPVGFWNHSVQNPFLPVTNSTYRINELNSGTPLLIPNTFDGVSAVPEGVPFFYTATTNPGLFANYTDALLDLPNENGASYRIANTYALDAGSFVEATSPGLITSVTANNEVTTITRLGDEYAYDDGSTELALAALAGQTLVQQYEAFTPEVLRGVSIRLPRTSAAAASNLTIDLVVYLGELESGNEPDYSMTVTPIYPETYYRDSLDGFTSYAFPDSIDIPTGLFYVGWRQNGNCSECTPVGLDRENIIPGTRFFRNASSSNWFEFDGCSTGALMVRPLVGDSPVPITNTTEPTRTPSLVEVFPNPASDFVQLRASAGLNVTQFNVELLDITGRRILNRTGIEGFSVTEFPTGTYFLRIIDPANGRSEVKKLMIQ